MDINEFITDFQEEGICTVDIDKIVISWGPLFTLYQFVEDDTYHLICMQTEMSGAFKVEISKSQAQKIIYIKGLISNESNVLKGAIRWGEELTPKSLMTGLAAIADELTDLAKVVEKKGSKIIKIDIQKTVEGWDYEWFIMQEDEKFHFLRPNSDSVIPFGCIISKEDAMTLIERLDLGMGAVEGGSLIAWSKHYSKATKDMINQTLKK